MDFFLAAFSTFLGATVALAADRLTRLHDARVKEEGALNALIVDLASKRVFVISDNWVWGNGEITRVIDSVFSIRTLVRDTRLVSRARSKALPGLRNMTRACNTFIEASERVDDKALQLAHKSLVAVFNTEVQRLHSLNTKRLLADTPGSYSL